LAIIGEGRDGQRVRESRRGGKGTDIERDTETNTMVGDMHSMLSARDIFPAKAPIIRQDYPSSSAWRRSVGMSRMRISLEQVKVYPLGMYWEEGKMPFC
jgi:hypothetical protein